MKTLTFEDVQPKYRHCWSGGGHYESSIYEVIDRDAVLETKAGTFIAKDQKRFNGNYTVGQKFAIVNDNLVDVVEVHSVILGWEDNPKASYNSVKEMKKELGLKNNRQLEELPYEESAHVIFKWLDYINKGTIGELWGIYLYEGRWSLGSGAQTFKAIELEEFDIDQYEHDEALKKAKAQVDIKQLTVQHKRNQMLRLQKEIEAAEEELDGAVFDLAEIEAEML